MSRATVYFKSQIADLLFKISYLRFAIRDFKFASPTKIVLRKIALFRNRRPTDFSRIQSVSKVDVKAKAARRRFSTSTVALVSRTDPSMLFRHRDRWHPLPGDG
jgi:hypothetical protein